MEIIIASNNKKKIEEIKAILPADYELKTLLQAGYTSELPETTGTIPGNAAQKARTFYEATGQNCLADDSGLLVEALNDAPGVDSAFYAGLPRNDMANIEKLLSNLNASQNRNASFVTVIALILNGKEFVFQGEVKGRISNTPTGKNGFGYDPVFIPEGYDQTFAEMPPDLKSQISHRKKALDQVIEFLKTYNKAE